MKKYLLLLACMIWGLVQMDAQSQNNSIVKNDSLKNPYITKVFTDENGNEIEEIIVPGRPPEDYRAPVAKLPDPDNENANVLADVPAFTWCFGCSATSAAMISGYYDRTGYENLYTGPTNGGVMPLNNSSWPNVVINGETRSQCPLSATRQGVDGRAVKGHVDDFWYLYDSEVDPYYGNWSQHTYGECTADYMGTNQYFNFQNTDGSTTFYSYTNGTPLYDYTDCEPSQRDGCHGFKLFMESRGYNVQPNGNYSQRIYGYEGNTLGFTWEQFKAEIDAGRPVMIQIIGHTMVGYGYDESGGSQLMYIHDTWDYNDHTMVWGGSYSGMQHYGVTVMMLEPQVTALNPPQNFSVNNQGYATWDSPQTGTEYIISHHNGYANNGIGANSAASWVSAARFDTDDLASYYGSGLTSVNLHICLDLFTYVELRIYKGGSFGNPGTMVYSEDITNDVLIDDWTTINLSSPVMLESGNEYWIGYYIDATGGQPASNDFGPAVPGKGDWMNFGGSWIEISTEYGLDVNWCIEGVVSAAKNTGRTKILSHQPEESRDLLFYNIYLDGSYLGNTTDLFWQYNGLNPGTAYTAGVSAVYSDGESDIVEFDFTLPTLTPPENFEVTDAGYATWNAPVEPIFEDDFESYTAGQFLTTQTSDWMTWSGVPGSNEDAYVTTEQALSGNNSVKITGSSDVVHLFGDLATGHYLLTANIFIPSGYGGYFNVMHHFGTSHEWAFEAYFSSDGTGFMTAGGNNGISFNYSTNTWFAVVLDIDLDSDWATVNIDGTQVHAWQWSLDAFTGDPGLCELGAIDFYSQAPYGQNPLYYFDDVVLMPADGSDVLTSYNLYLNGTQTGNTTNTHYQFTGLNPGQLYTAGVTAVYDEGESSIITAQFTYPATSDSYALSFDGSDDLATFDGFSYPTGDLTLEVWIRPAAIGATSEIMCGINYSNSSTFQFRLESNGALLYGENPNWTYVSTDACIEPNEWQHIALVREDGICSFYVNGQFKISGAVNEGVTPTEISIGGRPWNMDRFFGGDIDEVRIWSVARTPTELTDNMNNYLTGSETGLMGYWKMNEGSGQTAYDETSNNYNFQLGTSSATDVNDPEWIPTDWPYGLFADFIADVTSGNAPLTVQFTDLSSSQATSWAWDFQNDGTVDSYDQNPEFTFNDPGVYTVLLTVSDSKGSDTETKTDYITVTSDLSANFTWDVSMGPAPLTVQFTDLSSGNPTSWEWDFQNDGAIDSYEQNPEFTYETPGTYSIKLTVGDGYTTDSQVIGYIDVLVPLDAEFFADVTSGDAPLTVQFTDQSTGDPSSWEWDFENDGTIDSYDQNPVFTYDTPGAYSVSLTVYDSKGSDTEIKTDYITVLGGSGSISDVTASQRTDGSKMVDVTYNLSGSQTSYPIIFEVSFNDGSTYDEVTEVSGDVGAVEPGTGLTITWDAGAEFPEGFYYETVKMRVTAIDEGWECGDLLTDPRDGQQYETVLIGDQCWMAENLEWLPSVSPSSNGSTTNPYYYVYGYQGTDVEEAKATSNYQTYGALYNWPAAVEVCEEIPGWHLPTDNEWKILEGFADSQYPIGDPEWDKNNQFRGFDVGKNLKSTLGWDNNGNGTDLYGFSALPAGRRRGNNRDDFMFLGTSFASWTSDYYLGEAFMREIFDDSDQSQRYEYYKDYGFPVRCLKTEATSKAILNGSSNRNGFSGESTAFIMDTKNPEVTLSAPNGGGIYSYMELLDITWTATDDTFEATPISAGFSTEEGGAVTWLANNIANSGSTQVDPPDVSTLFAKAHVNAVDAFGNEGNDASDVYFELLETIIPLAAEFSADITSGAVPLTVQFTDLSTGGATSWEWDFENDGTIDANEQNPEWTYDELGSYSVSLTVGDGTSSNTETKTGYITVLEPPQISVTPDSLDFIVNITNGYQQEKTLTISNTGGSVLEIELYSNETVTDIDGNVYQTIQIGDQLYMAENLKVTHYRNGDPIPNVTDNGSWLGLTTGAYCIYDNNPYYQEIYGNLYNGYAVHDGRGLAPEGWHVPSDDEIKELEMHLGMSESQANGTYWRGTNEGSKLAGGFDLWHSGVLKDDPEFNISGFGFLPGGFRSDGYGYFSQLDVTGMFWSSTEYLGYYGWYRIIERHHTEIGRNSYYSKRAGLSVRCIKDDNELSLHQFDGEVAQYRNDWLMLSPAVLTIEPGMSEFVTVSVDAEILDPGEYTAMINIYSNDPENSTVDVPVTLTVTDTDLIADFSTDITSGPAPLTVQFTDQTIGIPASWAWDFNNDGTIDSYLQNPEFTYTDTGVYTVSLTVYDGKGSSTKTKVDYITVFEPLAAEFSADVTDGEAPLTIQFTDLSTGDPSSWEWDFENDGTIDSYLQNPEFTYTDPGVYTVSLTVSDSKGSDTETKTDYITVLDGTGSVSGVTALQRTDGSKLVDITYDLVGPEPSYTVILEVSFDSGENYVQVDEVTGDVGTIIPADGLLMTWDAGAEFPEGFFSETMRIRVSAIGTEWNCGDILTDPRDGQQYETVLIGNQCWMADNLNVGERIDGNEDMSDNGTLEKYCYNNDTANCDTYGGLYQWDEMMQYTTNAGVQGICPNGWHVSTDDEWKILEGAVDSQYPVGDPMWDNTGWRGLDAGGNLKVTGTALWNSPNTGATNSSGFTALPGGYCNSSGSFGYLGIYANFWTSDVAGSKKSSRGLGNGYALVYRSSEYNTFGFSVRCLKDLPNLPPQQPSNPAPEDGSENQSIGTWLSWTCTDPEIDPLTFDVYFGTSPIPPQVATGKSETTWNPGILNYSTEYFWKIVAHDNHDHTTEGPVWSFSTKEETAGFTCGDPLIDPRDGQAYQTVLIGDQCWMADNLNVGERIDGNEDMSDNGTLEKYCYNNDTANCDTYGGLYQWNEMMQYTTSAGTQGICPEGWYLPTDDEWKILEGTVDSQYPVGDAVWDGINIRGFDAGLNLKSSSGWGGNGNGTDLYGFGALPGGDRISSGSFQYSGYRGIWWSSTEGSGTYAWYRILYYDNNGSYRYNYYKTYGFSVRCIRDTSNLPPQQPSNPVPEDGSENQPIQTGLSWTCADPETDPLTFDVYFGTSSTPPQVATGQSETTYNPGTLDYSIEYFWKIVAHDDHDNTTEGPLWSFTTLEDPAGFTCGDVLTDPRDGQFYETVQIGNHCWMAENLNVGERIDGNIDMTDNGTLEKYCYNNDPANCDTYGGLYKWNEVMQYTTNQGAQGICPPTGGWHIPTDDEWKILEGTVDSQYPVGDPEWDNTGERGLDAGPNLKSTSGWANNGNGTDQYNFSWLPGGYGKQSSFYVLGQRGYFWSSDESDNDYALDRGIYYNNLGVRRQAHEKIHYFSVRCIKNN